MAFPTLGEVFRCSVVRNGSFPAMGWKEKTGWKSKTYSEVDTEVRKIAKGLHALGVRKGDRVSIFSPNRPEWACFDLAIVSLGAVTVPIYATSTAEDAAFILNHSEATFVILSAGDTWSKFRESVGELSGISTAILLDSVSETLDDVAILQVTDLKKRGEGVSNEELQEIFEAVLPEDLSTIMYTSGTTGRPKGVMLSHANITSNVEASLKRFHLDEKDASLSFLPLSHAFERTAGLYIMISTGVFIQYAENVAKVPQNLAELSPTVMVSVPRVFEKFYARVQDGVASASPLLRKIFYGALDEERRARRGIYALLARILIYPKIRARMGGKLRIMISGGAALNPEVAHFCKAIGFQLLEGYGLSETSPVMCVNPPEDNRIGTVGPAIEGVEVKIAEDGEVLTRGPNLMLGYFKDPEATSKAIDSEGWFHTGDIGTLDQDGYLKITDRKKELIVTSGGKNIAPQPIEGELKLSPLVEYACAVGDRQKYLAVLIVPNFEVLQARVRPMGLEGLERERLVEHEEVRALFQKVLDQYNRKQASYETLKKFKLLAKDWSIEGDEITATMKLKRRVIREKYAREIQEMFPT